MVCVGIAQHLVQTSKDAGGIVRNIADMRPMYAHSNTIRPMPCGGHDRLKVTRVGVLLVMQWRVPCCWRRLNEYR